MKKQVCMKIERYYDITADTEEQFKGIMASYTERLGNRFMRSVEDGLNENVIRFSSNSALVSSECLNDENTKYSVVISLD
jgi:hypothetical protein